MICYFCCYVTSAESFTSDSNEFTSTEIALIEDYISVNELKRNYIFVGSGLDFQCDNFTCEKYSMKNLEIDLYARGEWLYFKQSQDYNTEFHDLSVRNAGSNDRNVFILKLHGFTEKEMNTTNLIRMYDAKSWLILLIDEEDTFFKEEPRIIDWTVDWPEVYRAQLE